MKKYSIAEIKNYLNSAESFGDAVYFLSEESMDKAQQKHTDVEVDSHQIKIDENYWSKKYNKEIVVEKSPSILKHNEIKEVSLSEAEELADEGDLFFLKD